MLPWLSPLVSAFLRRNVLIPGYPQLTSMSQKAVVGLLAHEIGLLALLYF